MQQQPAIAACANLFAVAMCAVALPGTAAVAAFGRQGTYKALDLQGHWGCRCWGEHHCASPHHANTDTAGRGTPGHGQRWPLGLLQQPQGCQNAAHQGDPPIK